MGEKKGNKESDHHVRPGGSPGQTMQHPNTWITDCLLWMDMVSWSIFRLYLQTRWAETTEFPYALLSQLPSFQWFNIYPLLFTTVHSLHYSHCVVCLSSSVQYSRSFASDSLQPHGLQHARPPCSSPSRRACSNSCPSTRWCHLTISSSVVPFSSHLQSFPASGSFLMSQLFASGGQSIGVSASASVLPMNIQDWFPSEWTGWISLQSKGLSRVFSNTTVQKHQFFSAQLSL